MTTLDIIAEKAGCTKEELGKKVFGWNCRIVWNTENYNLMLSQISIALKEEPGELWDHKPDEEHVVQTYSPGCICLEELGYQGLDVIDKIIPLEKVDSWAGFHDAVYEAIGQSLEFAPLKKLFLSLPEHIQATAKEWGMSDTVFKDQAYIYLKSGQPSTEDRPEQE